jgi:hypothetical protein
MLVLEKAETGGHGADGTNGSSKHILVLSVV